MKTSIYKIKKKERESCVYIPLCPRKAIDLDQRLKALEALPKAHITHPHAVRLFKLAKKHMEEFEANSKHFWHTEKRHVAFDTIFYQAVVTKFKPYFK